MPRFSICIPNYNYAHYLGETLQSVLDQEFGDLEVLISDNLSTDDSVEVARAVADDRVSITVNRCNVGFARNLDRAAQHATGDYLLMLSSDDLMYRQALGCYDQLFSAVGNQAVAISATSDLIDDQGRIIGEVGPDKLIWRNAPLDDRLSDRVGRPVRTLPATEVLRRSLRTMRNPFSFLSTAYPRVSYEQVEGYGGGRLINPDKWFHWRLLGVVDRALFVEDPLFAYRWHQSNQTAQQTREGALKVLLDDYASTLELPPSLLERGKLTQQEVVEGFIEHDIARHGFATLARGQRHRARRIAAFGRGAYADAARANKKVLALDVLSRAGWLGERVAAIAYSRAIDRRPDRAEAMTFNR
jgi:glycosyltransferase involved in cell wall biosynthesis